MLELIFLIILDMFIATIIGFTLGYFFGKRKNNSMRYNVEPFWFR